MVSDNDARVEEDDLLAALRKTAPIDAEIDDEEDSEDKDDDGDDANYYDLHCCQESPEKALNSNKK